jgi:hypothetical protein
LETSAKNSINVEETFVTMSREIKEAMKKKQSASNNGVFKTNFGKGNVLKNNEDEESTASGSSSSASGGVKCCQ